MKLKLRIMSLTLVCIVIYSSTVLASNNISAPKLTCHGAVVIDQYSGRILYGKNHKNILPMASTTKIITAMVAIENGSLTDQITVSNKASSVNGSSVGLKEGEKISLEELIYGLMMKSGNDAAVAIAEHIGKGNINNFIALMNQKVLEIGLFDTHFVTPHGLDAPTHETTAVDLAKATAYALRNPVFQKIASCREISSGESGVFNRSYNNINKFLYRVPNADGVKTGYTGNAGKCLVASIKHLHGRYIAVTLNSGDRWKDCENLVNYAKENYKHIKISTDSISIPSIKVLRGNMKSFKPIVGEEIYFPVLPGEEGKVQTNFNLSRVIASPIQKGDQVGNFTISINGNVESIYPIVSNKDIKHKIYK